jgi:glycosyltransferase involved in cell wall biosynthesis
MPTRSPAPKDSRPTTAVVIATHKRAALLDRVLADLVAAPLSDAVTDILVVENGDPDDTRSVCERYSDAIPLRYHHVPESGKSNALNVALGMTEADFVIQLDDDVRVEPGTVGAYVEAARRFGPGHFFGGPVSPEYEGAPPAAWLRPWLTSCVVGWDLGR